jgi:hypothetical protein
LTLDETKTIGFFNRRCDQLAGKQSRSGKLSPLAAKSAPKFGAAFLTSRAVRRKARSLKNASPKLMSPGFYVSQAEIFVKNDQLSLRIGVTNKGVAPFYYDWPVEVIIAEEGGNAVVKTVTPWKLSRVLPDKKTTWKVEIKLPRAISDPKVSIRVIHPMPAGKPLRFANESQAADGLLSIN